MKHLPLLFALALAFATTAHAGWKGANPQVNIDDATSKAFGALGAVRNSPDTTQQLACWVVATSTGITGYCHARNVTGTIRQCSTSNPYMVQAIAAVDGDDHVTFTWATINGECTRVEVSGNSATPPKQL